MSTSRPQSGQVATARLTPTSYLVLGLLAREGPSTPYDLEGHVRATLGNFWSFPHTLLYSEPNRLAGLGLVVEERETAGRRRRVFAITSTGRDALKSWLDTPADEPTELRDPGHLQLFFGDLASAESRLRLAEQQLAIHQAKLAAYREDLRFERQVARSGRGQRTVEHWRGETLPMGIRYEGAAVDFWTDVAARARASIDPNAAASAATSDSTATHAGP
jgi:PadR family transcriptional regulator AphA